MANPFIGQIQGFGFYFAPREWARCTGALLQIYQYQALYSILSNYHGGDGRNTFAVPNLSGRAPLHVGGGQERGPNLSYHYIGERDGSSEVSLTVDQLPSHSHGQVYVSAPGDSVEGSSQTLAGIYRSDSDGDGALSRQNTFSSTPSIPANSSMSEHAISSTGSSMPHNNTQPYLTLNFCIALSGMYPSRN